MSQNANGNTLLRVGGRRYLLARAIWFAVVVVSLALLVTGLQFQVNHLAQTADMRSLQELGISLQSYAVYLILLSILVVLVHVVIAAVIFWRRSYDWVALLVSLTLVTNGAAYALSNLYASASGPSVWLSLASVIIYLGLVTSYTVLYVFPDGYFVPSWTKWLAIAWAVVAFLAVFIPDSVFSMTGWPAYGRVMLLVVWSGVGVGAQLFRYQNVSSPVQRQQIKWALLGLTAAAVGPIVFMISISASSVSNDAPNILYQRVGAGMFTFSFVFRLMTLTIFRLGTLLFPLSFGIAVMRYRLWEIDIILRRTLTYGVLTALLLVLYFVIIVLSQLAIGWLVPGASPFAVVISTLAIAALFNPLRHRVQNWIDRQFYRNKYDAEVTLEAFSKSLREEVDLDQLSERMLAVVEKTMHPEHISLCLIGPEGDERRTRPEGSKYAR